ncbi:MAG: hypothetical protein WB579_06655 [Bryobacteraceae bacterium]
MKPIGIALLAIALLVLTATPGMAQYVVSAKSGTINLTEGQVQLDGHAVESSLTQYPNIKEGSVLRTENGRAEVLLTPGVTLRLGEESSFKMITNRLIDTRLELLGGEAVVEADEIDKDTSVTIVVNSGAVSLPKAGIYRFSFAPSQLKVFKGEAAVLAGSETRLVGAGRMCALGSTAAVVEKFDANDSDALDHWSHRRGELMAMANVSGANLYNSSAGPSYYPYYSLGMGMPFMGCSGLGYMPFGYYGSGFWSYNQWYGMYTYVPCYGMAYSPYGYGFWSPGAVQGIVGSPGGYRGAGITRGPLRGPVSVPGRVPLALAMNGSHTPGFRGGTGITSAYSAGRSGFGGNGAGVFGGSAARGGFSGDGVFSGGGGYSGGGGSAAAGGHGGFAGGGAVSGAAVSAGGAAGGGGHR